MILRQFQVLLRKGTAQNHATGIFADNEVGEKHWLDFQTRVGEHVIFFFQIYYSEKIIENHIKFFLKCK